MTSIKDCQENIANFLISNIIILLRLTTKKEMSFKTLPIFRHSRTWVQSRDISENVYKMSMECFVCKKSTTYIRYIIFVGTASSFKK